VVEGSNSITAKGKDRWGEGEMGRRGEKTIPSPGFLKYVSCCYPVTPLILCSSWDVRIDMLYDRHREFPEGIEGG
jgi:hypothetical protein